MLRLFIPQQFRGVTLIPTRHLAIQITKTSVCATSLIVNRAGIQIKSVINKPIESNTDTNSEQAIELALKSVLEQAGKYDVLITCLNSTLCVFKPIRLPFISEQKAKLVIEHELEPALPYKIDNAVSDALITHENVEESSSQALGVATQKKFISKQLELFQAVNTQPNIVTTDVCALYNLSQYIPAISLQTICILIYIGTQTTTLVMVRNGAYQTCRSLQKGTLHIAREFAKQTSQTPEQILQIMDRPEANSNTEKDAHQLFISFWKDLEFTIESFLNNITTHIDNVQLYIAGQKIHVTALCTLATNKTGWSCSQIPIELKDPITGTPIKNVGNSAFAITTGAALPLVAGRHFNLLKKEFAPSQGKNIIRTMLIAGGIALFTIAGTFVLNWIRSSYLQSTLDQGAIEAIDQLRQTFSEQEIKELGKPIQNPAKELDSLSKKAHKTVSKQEETWQAFARSSRSPYLRYLYLLFNELDRKALGLQIDRLTIINNTITLEGNVRDYDALALFDRQLSESTNFVHVSGSLQEPTFRIELLVQADQG